MLSSQEIKALSILEELSASSLNISAQSEHVRKINELLQTLQEEAEAKHILNETRNAPPYTFVALARRRLVAAQKQSLENYNALRTSKTKKLSISNEQIDSMHSNNIGKSLDHDDAFAKSLHEAKSESITEILYRMRGLAEGEVLRSELNIGELDMSSRTLCDLQEKYSTVDVLLNGSQKLVRLLDEAEKWDRWCIMASLGFLATVMVYIIYRRILSGPIKLLLWGLYQTLRLPRLISKYKQLLNIRNYMTAVVPNEL